MISRNVLVYFSRHCCCLTFELNSRFESVVACNIVTFGGQRRPKTRPVNNQTKRLAAQYKFSDNLCLWKQIINHAGFGTTDRWCQSEAVCRIDSSAEWLTAAVQRSLKGLQIYNIVILSKIYIVHSSTATHPPLSAPSGFISKIK